MQKYQLIIIGGGSAGFAAATKANDDEIKTALINEGPIGGTCINISCVPSKYLLESTNFYTHAKKPVARAQALFSLILRQPWWDIPKRSSLR
jgi:mercuric reductase